MLESKGFRGEIGRRTQANKIRKQDARTAKQRRQKKLDALQPNPQSWKNLEAYDPRTPSTYFQKRGATPALNKLKGRLDELLSDLYALKECTDNTLATKKIIDMEIERKEWEKYKQVSLEYARKVSDALTEGTHEDIVDALWDALDYKTFCRVDPYMQETGKQMEEQIFWVEQYGNK